MSSIYDLPRVALPYPEIEPWFWLTSHVTNGWASSQGSFPFIGKVARNEATLYMVTRFGTDATICETLPDELLPQGHRTFGAYSSGGANVGVNLDPNGRVSLFAPNHSGAGLWDGTLINFVFEITYPRKA